MTLPAAQRDIRAWAKAQGMAVSKRGRIPARVAEQHQARHQTALNRYSDHEQELLPGEGSARVAGEGFQQRELTAAAGHCSTGGRAPNRLPPGGYPAPAAAIRLTEAAARHRPVILTAFSRSPRSTRASKMVPAGYSEVMTAVTASSPRCVARK